MALKYFLIFAGAFFASSMIIMAFIKPLSSSFGNYGKKPWIFNLVSSALVSGIAFATTYITKNLFYFLDPVCSIPVVRHCYRINGAQKILQDTT
ncbi:hypothetical protein KRR40_04490 [Niabella defluvii]|nr:hypothetical protein KRR40_04490 [Niabella sp. I65]